MNEKEEHRLLELQKDGEKGVGAFLWEKLTYPDLLLLVKEDKRLRQLIRCILQTDQEDNEPAQPTVRDATESTAVIQPDRSLAAAIKVRSSSQPTNSISQEPLRPQLQPEFELLALIRSDAELATRWLPDESEPEGRQLIRLVALLAHWDQVLQLWDRLAERCKSERRAVSVSEQRILAGALDIHNLIWRDRAARLQPVAPGTVFDYKQHERGVSVGETIRAEWLPGLLNAAGQLQKKPLVET